MKPARAHLAAIAASLLAGLGPGAREAFGQNAIVLENQLPGNPASEWDVAGGGDASIAGFAADISYAPGETVDFKIDTAATDYRLDVYRLGWYAGLGARKVATLQPSAALPQGQPACLSDAGSGLVDCGNWAVSASWTVPAGATSGIYLARLVREDPEDGRASHVVFVVRDDLGGSDLLLQTSDATWQAYNTYGGNSLYTGSPAGRAYKVSYNRPFTTRCCAFPAGSPYSWLFNAEYAMVRWLERNGYDVSYTTGVDTDRRGAELLEHQVFLSVGHDEYWSAGQRASAEAARDAGVHLAFFSGNEVFWKTRFEPSIDGSAAPHRTLVCYKETHANAKIDPLPTVWTGTWRDPRFSPPADGGQPENALTGTIFTVNGIRNDALAVPEADGKMRFWRNTSIALLAPGDGALLPTGTLGFEWDEDVETGVRPPGLIRLSTTTVSGVPLLQDYGSTYASGTATHHLALYRHPSGALVFGAGTVQWSWGLDDQHDLGGTPVDARMQQATVNLLADMGAQPGTLQAGLVAASASTDATAPTSTINAPAAGATVQGLLTVSGTASDAGGGVVGGVEVSVDGGATWHPASGRASWTRSFPPQAPGPLTIRSRAVDDSGNLEAPGPGVTVTSAAPVCPCSIWNDAVVPPGNLSETDGQPLELGVKFRSDVDGFVTGLRFYRSPSSGGPHVGHLWTSAGVLLATAPFPNPGASGWQEVALEPPVPIAADSTYVASYHSPSFYAFDGSFFTTAVDNPPLHALADGVDGGNGVYLYGPPGSFPTQTYQASNYWADVVFEEVPGSFSVWDDAALPASPAAGGGAPIEVGVKLRAEVPGEIRALRFYKGAANTGTHVGHLWSGGGTLLAEAAFANETAEGWQEVALDPPVAVAAESTFVASYHSASGFFALDVGGLSAGLENRPLRILADGEEGGNGVFAHGASGSFPDQTGSGDNYWVDVRFAPDSPFDADPPGVTSVAPAAGAAGVPVGVAISATFDESIDPATVTGATFELRDAASALVAAGVSYAAASRTATLAPDSPLAFGTAYTATLVGGAAGVTDLAGNPLSVSLIWSFTTADPPPPPPDEGPGGPILVVASAANPFGRYLAEILRTEGLNAFTVTDASLVDAGLLATHEVVILGELALDAAQLAMLEGWVDAGGQLIAMRPDPQLAGLLGLAGPSGTLSDAYLAIDTAQAPGSGLVGETLQFHGSADLWSLAGATALATLYSDAATATAHPAVTWRAVGANGGSAAAFAYDLARSVVTTRQGNPAWAGQERDGVPPRRSDDLFFGDAAGDPQPDWIDLDKVAIPQADEQQRLLAGLIRERIGFPLPRFWYFPSGARAVVVLTGDQHGCCGGTRDRFDANLAADPPGCSVEDWECVRSSSYVYPGSGMSDAEGQAYTAQGFELGVHVNTGCADWTPAALDAFFASQLAAFAGQFPSLPVQDSQRTHCIAWSDWSSAAAVELAHGIRLDTNYYYWPPAWVADRPGLFTGSGMPMRFAAADGTLIDVYQAATQMTDESGQSYPFTIDALLDRALGPEGYFGAFVANMHTDGAGGSIAGAASIVASAQARGVPVVSGRQLLGWLDGRNASSFGSLEWTGGALQFTVSRHAAARNLRALLPASAAPGALASLTRNGQPVAFSLETVKGVGYAVFAAETGSYLASYTPDATPPVLSNLGATPGLGGSAAVTWDTDEPADARVDFGTDPEALSSQVSDPALGLAHSVPLSGLLPGTTYYYRATSADAFANAATEPPIASPAASFATPGPVCFADGTAAEFGAGSPGSGTALVEVGDGEVALAAAVASEFEGTALPAGWSGTAWEAGGSAGVSGGVLGVNGARAGTDAVFGPGRALEFSATFQAAPFQHVGFGDTFEGAPWAIFSTGTAGTSLLARSAGGGSSDTPLGAGLLGSAHRFRIEWGASSVAFYVDGALVASHAVSIAQSMRPLASDLAAGGPAVSVGWLRMSPYPATGSFDSRIFDAGGTSSFGAVTWSAEVPAGTSVAISVRAGYSPAPDASWSPFAPIPAPGAPAGVAGRYAQYRADLATGEPAATPLLEDVALTCAPAAICGNGFLEPGEECDDGGAVDGDGCSSACAWESEDADGDGLLNVYETGTGVYVSPTDTGTNPLHPDTDGDGFRDGVEVAVGTDPNDPESFPVSVPALGTRGLSSLALALIAASAALLGLAPRRRGPQAAGSRKASNP